MLLKLVIVALVIVILYCLGSALMGLLRQNQPERMATALTWRICLSIALFVLLFIFYLLGWMAPHGIVP